MTYQIFNLRTGEFHGDIAIMKEHEAAKLNRIRQLSDDHSRWIESDVPCVAVTNNIPEILAKFSMFGALLALITLI